MCGSAGCYAKQFQLDRFLDHLTVIIKSQNERKTNCPKKEFQLIKVKGTARNGGFNSSQPGTSDSVQNGFAPQEEVIGGTDGCYITQFQLDQFLDHLTVIIKSQNERKTNCQKTNFS